MKAAIIDYGRAIGFDPVDAGPLRSARYLEAMGMLMISLGFELGLGINIGYRLVH